MPFVRNEAERWHSEVPGARWFRADLHLHDLDDHPGGQVNRPQSVGTGLATDPGVQRLYARAFLQSAVDQGVEVLGLSPHAARSGPGDASSATWKIVDVWNTEDDDDGIPFREKIYAVFPGFEPSFTAGSRGAHLIFLFDPEVGRDFYLAAFSALMGGTSPWQGGNLRNSPLHPTAAFEALDNLCDREDVSPDRIIVLAPHAFSGKGILSALKGQVAADFDWSRVSALELPDNRTDLQMFETLDWLEPKLNELHHGLYHASDGYELALPVRPADADDIPTPGSKQLGHRTTLMKMACPTVAALKQAFLSRDSRTRLIYTVDDDGELVEADDLPDPLGVGHPWIRSVAVTGGQSFFGGSADGEERSVEFRLSPSLTCIIGGRMSGKSTLLDGLRMHLGLDPPAEERAKRDVEARAQRRFLLGSPEIQIDFAGSAVGGEWPAKFFTQRELQDAVDDQRGLREILFHLIPRHTEALKAHQAKLATLDEDLSELANEIVDSRSDAADCEQALQEAADARAALKRFEAAGADQLAAVQEGIGRVKSYRADIGVVRTSVEDATSTLTESTFPRDESGFLASFFPLAEQGRIRGIAEDVAAGLRQARENLDLLQVALESIEKDGVDHSSALQEEVVAALVDAGGTREDLMAFERYQTKASDFGYREEQARQAKQLLAEQESAFGQKVEERQELADGQRALMNILAEEVSERFKGRIRIGIAEEGITDSLDEWIRSLRQKGVTRWWNNKLEEGSAPGVIRLYEAYKEGDLQSLGMSEDVVATFSEAMTANERDRLRSLRSPDEYLLELRVSDEPEEYREMSELSGGQQVSLLLSLLLQAQDDRPIVIDQPEDELDSEYLFGTVLPVLRTLKGRRQIIFATHNANIVVNGDADQVISLKADHESGWVEIAGAIEVNDVRRAIVDTVDGGEKAFQLRQLKYGF